MDLIAPPKTYENLRAANIARQTEWDTGMQIDFDWRCNEMFGEVGEACNVIKKLHRERLGLPGSRASVSQLAEELADVVICLDLISMDADVPFSLSHRRPDPPLPLLRGAAGLAMYAGRFCGLVFAEKRTKNDISTGATLIANCLMEIVACEQISILRAVQDKFNATTSKVGLTTFLKYPFPNA